jgi:hypothetical protein
MKRSWRFPDAGLGPLRHRTGRFYRSCRIKRIQLPPVCTLPRYRSARYAQNHVAFSGVFFFFGFARMTLIRSSDGQEPEGRSVIPGRVFYHGLRQHVSRGRGEIGRRSGLKEN